MRCIGKALLVLLQSVSPEKSSKAKVALCPAQEGRSTPTCLGRVLLAKVLLLVRLKPLMPGMESLLQQTVNLSHK